MKKITDPTFRYIPSHKTDVAITIRREQKRLDDERKAAQERLKSIIQIRRSKP